MDMLYGKGFLGAVFPLQLLAISILFHLISMLNAYFLYAIDRQKQNAMFLFLGIMVNVGLNFALIPLYGVLGAVSSAVAASFLVYCIRQLYVLKCLRSVMTSSMERDGRVVLK